MKPSYFYGFFSIKETQTEIILKRKWIWYPLHIFTLLIGTLGMFGFFANGMIWQGILASFIFYLGLCGLFNYIKITVNNDIIEKKNYPFPWLTNVKILTKDFLSAGDAKITTTLKVDGTMKTTGKAKERTTGYNVKLWINKIDDAGKTHLSSVDFQDFTVGDYEASDFLVLCLNKFIKKDDLQKDTQNN